MALLSNGNQRLIALATMGLLGALYHVINHGVFKGLLFLNAGSILYATGTQDLNKLGGLMKFMPLTALTAIVASFSISGVPLFNGFVSKWSIYVAAVQGSMSAKYLAVCTVIAILTSALTLASFIKFFGVSFLSRTSSLVMERVKKVGELEVGWMMQISQVFLAAFCILLGIMPAIVFHVMQQILESSRQGFGVILAGAMPTTSGLMLGVEEIKGVAMYGPFALLILLSITLLATRAISKFGSAKRRTASPWLCGYASEEEHHRYSAHNFYGEIKRYFRWLGGMPNRQRSKQENIKES